LASAADFTEPLRMISELLQTARPAIFQKMLRRHYSGMKVILETDIQVRGASTK